MSHIKQKQMEEKCHQANLFIYSEEFTLSPFCELPYSLFGVVVVVVVLFSPLNIDCKLEVGARISILTHLTVGSTEMGVSMGVGCESIHSM